MNAPTRRDPRKVAAAVAAVTALVASFEGLRQVAYLDPVGIPTVCFGHTEGVRLGDRKTPDECRALLSDDLHTAARQVQSCTPANIPEPVLAAFASATYNIGPRVACGPGSTAARYLAAGQWAAACRELPRWDKARIAGILAPLPGLTRRRAAEMDFCLTHSP